MPCDQVRQTTIQWTEATRLDLVKVALEGMGCEYIRVSATAVDFNDANGNPGRFYNASLTVDPSFDVEALKCGYADAVIDEMADKFKALGFEETTGQQEVAVQGFTKEW